MPKTIEQYLDKAEKAKAAVNKFRKNKGLEPYFDEPKKAKWTAVPLRANAAKGPRARAIAIAATEVNKKSEIEGMSWLISSPR